MRIDPTHLKKDDPFKHLTVTQKVTRQVAIGIVFIGVFYWFVKIVIG